MDTQNLKAFVEVAETSSFSHAAEILHLTQPAVSKRIAALESQLDCKLFDRINRTVQLTEAGHSLLPKARQILLAVQEAKRSIDDLQGDISGQLRIGISHHIGLHRLPPVLQAFTRQHPNVHFDIDFMDSEEAHEQVMHGQIELGVVTLDPADNSPLRRQPVWQDKLLVTVSPDHPLAQSGRADITTLSQFPAILPGLNTYTGQIIKALFQQHSLKLDVSMATNYLETIKMMVSIGLGWSVLPHTMIDDSLKVLDIDDLKLHRTLGYVVHPNRSLSNAANAFVEALQANGVS
ncbi:LysR family transcriptional regulator [Oceanicoccus sp. KOV_DT_Chl]|uniref:LysR family transcriptional regulator n=1 Tax=Oceanicoccus sp. KOV_DT_Chl TaxID=1904639 RepID=UPI000C7C9705|nr:LysR family transcriptional regulator [Oceanicoccus sp. KOV_DT_Chl]